MPSKKSCAALLQPISIQMMDQPLLVVACLIANQIGVPFTFDEAVLMEVGLGPDTRVTINLRGLPGRSNLALLLSPLKLYVGPSP